MAENTYHGDEIARKIEARLKGNVEAACILVQRAARQNVRTGGESGLHRRSGQLINSINYDIQGEGPEITGRIGVVKLIYARIHELGGTTHPTVTARMRAWAWAMYYKMEGAARTGMKRSARAFRSGLKGKGMAEMSGAQSAADQSDFYKGIALTKKSKLTVVIPARPYLRPALRNNLKKIREILARGIGK